MLLAEAKYDEANPSEQNKTGQGLHRLTPWCVSLRGRHGDVIAASYPVQRRHGSRNGHEGQFMADGLG